MPGTPSSVAHLPGEHEDQEQLPLEDGPEELRKQLGKEDDRLVSVASAEIGAKHTNAHEQNPSKTPPSSDSVLEVNGCSVLTVHQPEESTAGSPSDLGAKQRAAELSHPTKECSSDLAQEQKQAVEETESEDFVTENEDDDTYGTLYNLEEWPSKRARLLEERSAIQDELRNASSSEY